ncbi:MAG TPA: DNA polymerase IV [Acidimicrobiales bacterium]|nr:DNA polymerase IV [Acidimicrobiales bacterium]
MTVSPTPWPRAVLHVDMDCFYAAVEVLDDPSLRGKPVVVGGTGRRGVVAAANYEARVYGVRSATPMVTARRLCPRAVVLPGRFDRYEDISRQLRALLRAITPLVEPISLDEAFLDVTGATRRSTSPEQIAAALRAQVHSELGLICSVGVATSKHIAKLASVSAKPRALPSGVIEPGVGVRVIAPGTELAFLHPLPIRALWGVGEQTAKKLASLGVKTVGELAAMPLEALTHALGPHAGEHLLRLANGVDDRPVVAEVAAKSISHEETFAHDITERDRLHREVVRQSDAVASRMSHAGLAARTVVLKVRYGDFTSITRSKTPGPPIEDGVTLADVANDLLDAVDIRDGVRLLGVGVSNLVEPPPRQLDLLAVETDAAMKDVEAAKRAATGAAVAAIRDKFGDNAVAPATLAGRDGIRRRRFGQQQWGPGSPADSDSGLAGTDTR